MASDRLRIILADAHPLVRSGLRLALATALEFAVVGDTADGSELLALVDRWHPDAVVVDSRLPGGDGLDLTRAIRARHPATAVILLTLHDSAVLRELAAEAGAATVVLKDAGIGPLLAALRAACAPDG